jgi:hypothetical protein
MDNRRKENRKKVMTFTLVYDDSGKLLGYLGNLTEQGAMVIGEKAHEVNTPIRLSIQFREELPGGLARDLKVDSRVARCVADQENPREFNIGLEFTQIDSEQAKIIEAILDRYHFRYRSWAKEQES